MLQLVSARRYGRLGNQLFQMSAGIGHSVKHGGEFILQDSDRVQSFPEYFPSKCKRKNDFPFIWIDRWKEPAHSYFEIPHREGIEYLLLDGYFQSYKYFDFCKQHILDYFGFSVIKTIPRTVAVHIRRDDYLNYPKKHPVVTLDYLSEAIKKFDQNESNFFLFSDDMPWIRKEMPAIFSTDCYRFVEKGNPLEDMMAMASCEHNIISNSTFGWWSAYANNNPNKIVVTPDESNWFGPENAHLDTCDLIPFSWIRIKY